MTKAKSVDKMKVRSSLKMEKISYQKEVEQPKQAMKDNTVDTGIINQYETAMQMLNAELQKLLLINRQLEAENATFKAQSKNNDIIRESVNGNDATTLWLNSQLKDAKSSLFDLRHQV